jgi:hypothetical protein
VGVSSIDEYSARIGAAIQAVEQARTSVGQAKSDGEDLAGQFEGMGAEAMGATIRSSVDQGNEADGVLAEAINKLKEMQSTAESARGNGLRGGGGDVTPPESTWRNEVGDQLQPGPASPHRGFMKQELKSNDDDDKSKSRMNRFGRGFLTKKGDDVGDSVLKPAAEHVYIAKSISNDDLDPPDPDSWISSTQHRTEPAVTPPPLQQPTDGSLFVAGVALSVVVVKGGEKAKTTVSKLWSKWRKHG